MMRRRVVGLAMGTAATLAVTGCSSLTEVQAPISFEADRRLDIVSPDDEELVEGEG